MSNRTLYCLWSSKSFILYIFHGCLFTCLVFQRLMFSYIVLTQVRWWHILIMIHLFQTDSIISSHYRNFLILLNIKGPDQFPHKSVTFGSDSRRCLALSSLCCHGENATAWGIFTALFDLLLELRLNIRKVCFQEGICSYINLSDLCFKSNFWYNF